MHNKPLGPSQRCLKVGEEIRRLLASVFQHYFFEDPSLSGGSVTVTEVQMSPDLKHAKVFFLPLGGACQKEMLGALRQEAPKIRHLLGKKIRLRHVPALDFRIDETFDAVDALNHSLSQVL
jgi:ribosome-binding factor A